MLQTKKYGGNARTDIAMTQELIIKWFLEEDAPIVQGGKLSKALMISKLGA